MLHTIEVESRIILPRILYNISWTPNTVMKKTLLLQSQNITSAPIGARACNVRRVFGN